MAAAKLTEAQIEVGQLWAELVGIKCSLKTLDGRARYANEWAKVRRLQKREKAIEHRLTILKENA